MGASKAIDVAEVVSIKEVVVVEEDVVAIQIIPTTPGMLFTSNIFLGISEVPIGMPFRGAVDHILAVNVAMEGLGRGNDGACGGYGFG